jgi:hypothetical protein
MPSWGPSLLLTDSVSGVITVVWPRGGWQMSEAYMAAWLKRDRRTMGQVLGQSAPGKHGL